MLKPIPLFVLLFGLLGSQGCGPKKSQAPQPLSEAQFVSEIENAFSDAQGAIPEKIETLITQYEDEEFIEAERTIDDLIYTETKSLNKAQRTILG